MKKILAVFRFTLLAAVTLTFSGPRFLSIPCALWPAEVFAESVSQAAAESKPILIINEDNDHYFKQTSDLMTLEALQAYVDQMKNSHVTHFFMCPHGQRTSYASKVHEPIWEGMADGSPINYGPGKSGIRWATNCRKLFDMGIDPYHVWIERCRKNGISPWISMRMNDVHFVSRENYFRNFNFWREHKELWRVPETNMKNWMDCAFDYSKKESYDFYFACAKELLERYDMDGFELDWMRFCLHLTPGKEREQAHCLTRFVREIRQYANEIGKKRGRKIPISVRVPATPQASAALGMNAVEWANEGLIDQIVASCFFSSSDFNIAASDWKKLLKDPKFPVLTAADDGVSCGNGIPRMELTHEMYLGWANAMLGNGSDGLYLFNLVYRPEKFQKIIAEGLEKERILNLHRRHVVSYRDFLAAYDDPALNPEKQLPRNLTEAKAEDFTVQFGKKPTKEGKLWVVAAFMETSTLDKAKFSVKLNGIESKNMEELPNPTLLGNAKRAVRFLVPLAAAKDGLNTVSIRAETDENQKISWLELEYVPEK